MKNINWNRISEAIVASLTLLAALPYTLGDVATIIPPTWKPKIVVAGVVATLALRFYHAIFQQNGTPTPTAPPNQTPPTNGTTATKT